MGLAKVDAPVRNLFDAEVGVEFGPRLTIERPPENEQGRLLARTASTPTPGST